MSLISSESLSALESGVRRAGDLLLELWPGRPNTTGMKEELTVRAKGDGTLVSIADERSNEELISAIEMLFPEDAILSEESAIDEDALRKAHRVWVIDPLDGTSAFLEGRDDFSVLVGLCEGQRPVHGLMYFPARNILVVSSAGSGTQVNGKTVHVSTQTVLGVGRVYIRNFECTRPEVASPMMDSGLAFMKVATGELDGAIIRMVTHREWDVVAPATAIVEAGGKVTDEEGRIFPCGVGTINFRYLVASNNILHHDLLSLIPK